MTIQEFAKAHGIEIKTETRGGNPLMEDSAGMDHWTVLLTRKEAGGGRRQFSTPFSKGHGHEGKAPTVEEVLECLQSDAFAESDFGYFCQDFGYDEDSRKAKRLHERVMRQNKKVERFMGELFETFLSCQED